MEGQKVDTIRSLKFDGKNFLAYKEGIKAALRARKCWKILIGKGSKPEKDGTDAAKKKRKEYREKVLLLNDILTSTLDDGTRVRLAHLKNPQDKWTILVDDFEALLTGLGEKCESMVETFDNLDDYSLPQVKIKLTSREERLNQAKAVTEAKARKRRTGQTGTSEAQFGGHNRMTMMWYLSRRGTEVVVVAEASKNVVVLKWIAITVGNLDITRTSAERV